jgi:hypothetical protein
MSASGLGATDFLGKRATFGGIASEFYDAIAAAYNTNYVRSFEPHVAKQVFEKLLADAGVPVVYNEQLDRTSGKGVTFTVGREPESQYGEDMEPVFMTLAQSAAIAAGLAMDKNTSVQAVAYPALKEKLLAAKQIITSAQVPSSKAKAAPKKPTP